MYADDHADQHAAYMNVYHVHAHTPHMSGYHDVHNTAHIVHHLAHADAGAGLFHWLKHAAHSVGHTLSKAAHGIEHGVSKAAHGIEHGVEGAVHAVGKVAVAAEHGIEKAGKFVVKEGVKGLEAGAHWAADHIKDGLVDVGKFVAKNGLQLLTDGGCALQPELCEVFEMGSQALQKGVINPALDKAFSKLEDKATGAADKWLEHQGDKLTGANKHKPTVKSLLQAGAHPANEFQRLDEVYLQDLGD